MEDGGGRGEAERVATGSDVERSRARWSVWALPRNERLGKDKEYTFVIFR
jgi:hypothetical protein